jgi:hypothetical protein
MLLRTACPPPGCMPGSWSVLIIILKMLLAFFSVLSITFFNMTIKIIIKF